jgi:RNA polymerase-binding transcription factor DksA
MKKSEQKVYLKRLLSLRSRLTGEVLHLTDEAFMSNAGGSSQPSHLAELGSETYQQEVTLQMIQSEGNAIGEITDAIDRIQNGTFGKCETCGKVIPKSRLEAIPYTRYCVSCAKVAEKQS